MRVKSISHITGGGFYENIPRSLPEGAGVHIPKAGLKIPPIFGLLQKTGGIPERDMFNTFNMGVGMSVIVSPDEADEAASVLRANGVDAYVMGEVTGDGEVDLC